MASRRHGRSLAPESLICRSLAHIPRRCPEATCRSFRVEFNFFGSSHPGGVPFSYDRPWFECRDCGCSFRLGSNATEVVAPNSPDSSTDSFTHGSDPAPEVTSQPVNARRSMRLEERRNKRLEDINGGISAMELGGGRAAGPSNAPTDEPTPPNDQPPVEDGSDQPMPRGRSRKQTKPFQSPFM